MEGKEQILTGLKSIYNQWELLLESLNDEQITQPIPPSNWSVKDIVGHMWAWQQASVARLEAALQGREPAYPEWWTRHAPDPEEDLDRTNAYIYEINRDKKWPQIYEAWRTQFQHYVELTKQIAEEDLLELGRYPWMGNYALSASSMGSLDHHEEHYESLRNWLEEQGSLKAGG